MCASIGKPKKFYHITLDHLPDEHLSGIGLVAVAWSFLEGIIERIAWCASRLSDSRGQAYTTHMSLPARLDAMCTAVHEEFPDSNPDQKLPKIAKRIKKLLAPSRGEIVHSRIFKLDEFGAVFRKTYKARMKRTETTKVVALEEYETTAADIIKFTNELVDLANEIMDLVAEKDSAPTP